MRFQARFLLLLPLAALLACGSSTSTPSSTATTPANLTGNWEIDATSNGTLSTLAGTLTFSNGVVTGVLYPNLVLNGFCQVQLPGQRITGNIDAAGNMTLTVPLKSSQGGSYGTATITATIGSNPQSATSGSLLIVSGLCATTAIPISISQYAPVTGTYTGTVYEVDPTTGAKLTATATTVTAILTQFTSPDAIGSNTITGTVTTTGAFATSYNITNVPLPNGTYGQTSYVLGSQFISENALPAFYGSINSTATSISITLKPNNRTTDYYGSLTRQ